MKTVEKISGSDNPVIKELCELERIYHYDYIEIFVRETKDSKHDAALVNNGDIPDDEVATILAILNGKKEELTKDTKKNIEVIIFLGYNFDDSSLLIYII